MHGAERERIEALRSGDEAAFVALVAELDPILRRVVRHYVASPAVAEEVVQETWLGVLRGIFAFEGRSSLRTWVCRILINRARSRAEREGRTVSFDDRELEDSARPGAPASARPIDPGLSPEEVLLGREAERALAAAIEQLPTNLRLVLTLRDVEGWSSEEVCNVLAIRETNQRVLLHRARSKVRERLEPYMRPARGTR